MERVNAAPATPAVVSATPAVVSQNSRGRFAYGARWGIISFKPSVDYTPASQVSPHQTFLFQDPHCLDDDFEDTSPPASEELSDLLQVASRTSEATRVSVSALDRHLSDAAAAVVSQTDESAAQLEPNHQDQSIVSPLPVAHPPTVPSPPKMTPADSYDSYFPSPPKGHVSQAKSYARAVRTASALFTMDERAAVSSGGAQNDWSKLKAGTVVDSFEAVECNAVRQRFVKWGRDTRSNTLRAFVCRHGAASGLAREKPAAVSMSMGAIYTQADYIDLPIDKCCATLQVQKVDLEQYSRGKATKAYPGRAFASEYAPVRALIDWRSTPSSDPCDRQRFVVTCVIPHTHACNKRNATSTKGAMRAAPARALAERLRQSWETEDRTWTYNQIKQKVMDYDPSASSSYITNVKSFLLVPHHISDKQENELAQGLASCLSRLGCGVNFATADSHTVLMQAIDMSRAKYTAERRKAVGTGNFIDYDTEGALRANANRYADTDSQGVKIDYFMGWTLVPPNTRGKRLDQFVPSSAYDWARATHEAQGSYVARATYDANRHVHLVTLQRLLCTETSTGCEASLYYEEDAHGIDTSQSFGSPKHLTITDQGRAIRNSLNKKYPDAPTFLCQRHLKHNLSKTAAGRTLLPIYDACLYRGRAQREAVDRELTKLHQDHPASMDLLTRLGLPNTLPAYLPQGVHTHGITTSNAAEVSFNALNVARVRSERSLFRSLLAAAQYCEATSERIFKKIGAARTRSEAMNAPSTQPPTLVTDLCRTSQKLPEIARPIQESVGEGDSQEPEQWLVRPSSGVDAAGRGGMPMAFYKVCPEAARMQAWDYLCSCGCPAVYWTSLDKHVHKVLSVASVPPPYVDYQKHWTTQAGWEKQAGSRFRCPTYDDIVAETERMKRAGLLKALVTPDINIVQPCKKTNGKRKADQRDHDVLEEQMAAAGSVRADEYTNSVVGSQGRSFGRGVKSMCGTCRRAGHHAGNCPFGKYLLGGGGKQFSSMTSAEDGGALARELTTDWRTSSHTLHRHLHPSAGSPEVSEAASRFEECASSVYESICTTPEVAAEMTHAAMMHHQTTRRG